MRLLYPSDPLDRTRPDEPFVAEVEAASALGLGISLFSFEDFETGKFRPRPPLEAGEETVYRGWMLTPEGYADLHTAIVSRGAIPLTGVEPYRLCHHLPEWYPLCTDLTPETVFLPPDADFGAALHQPPASGWDAWFVKDYVKSLTTQRGSVARSAEEIAEIVSLIERFRGSIEGGICLRRFERFVPDSEERYFVFQGRAHAHEGPPPHLVETLAERIDSPFFSVDLVRSVDGPLRLVELGDGQVSDRKRWPPERLVAIFGKTR